MNDSDRVLTIGVVDADPIATSREVAIARTPAELDRRIVQLRTVSNRLVWALAVLVVVGIPAAVLDSKSLVVFPTPAAVLFVGFVGGFVGLQRRLKALTDEDLTLLANSWVCIALSPIVGAILAELVYLLFASGLLEGSMCPHFVKDANSGPTQGLQTIFAVNAHLPQTTPRFCSGASLPDFLKSLPPISSASSKPADCRRKNQRSSLYHAK